MKDRPGQKGASRSANEEAGAADRRSVTIADLELNRGIEVVVARLLEQSRMVRELGDGVGNRVICGVELVQWRGVRELAVHVECRRIRLKLSVKDRQLFIGERH